MSIRIALAGNPNSGKTTLFNALTGSNQFVGNWPGVTVEKKEGKLKKHNDVIITDLPGIYSLSPYTLEEVVARNYLINERPDAILNIVDGTNLERNLYLTTQLTELGIPVVIAVNMMDIVKKNGDKINTAEMSRALGCKVVEISALKGTGIMEAAEAAIEAAEGTKTVPQHSFSGAVEHAIAHIEEAAVHHLPAEQQRWYAIKIFERDEKVLEQLKLDPSVMNHIEEDIKAAEAELDDDAESIITNERYIYIASIIQGCIQKKSAGKLTTSDKIDKVVTNRWAALPIFAVVMFIVYYISVTTVGTWATDWANDGVFGDGWHLFGIGSSAFDEDMTEYAEENIWTDELTAIVRNAGEAGVVGADEMMSAIEDQDFGAFDEAYGTYADALAEKNYDISGIVDAAMENAPDTSEYGVWVPGIPVLAEKGLDALHCTDWLKGLILDGIIGGVGAVLGFVPQMLVLFIFLAFLESCGYMARIAFVMDRIFRKFGLSGKSFIPMLIGTGCGVPGIMASRTIENDRDRKMTIMLTPFISCSAKIPVYSVFAMAFFKDHAALVMMALYVTGIVVSILVALILKGTVFSGKPVPFVMELPNYRLPSVKSVLQLMWDKAKDFLQRAFTIIFVATIIIWFLQTFDTRLNVVTDSANSLLAVLGRWVAPIFTPLGFGDWRISTSLITGFTAKEAVVSTMSVLCGTSMSNLPQTLGSFFTPLSAVSFLVFTLLYTPCVAAIAAIRREMDSALQAVGIVIMQCGIAWLVAFGVYRIGSLL